MRPLRTYLIFVGLYLEMYLTLFDKNPTIPSLSQHIDSISNIVWVTFNLKNIDKKQFDQSKEMFLFKIWQTQKKIGKTNIGRQ